MRWLSITHMHCNSGNSTGCEQTKDVQQITLLPHNALEDLYETMPVHHLEKCLFSKSNLCVNYYYNCIFINMCPCYDLL